MFRRGIYAIQLEWARLRCVFYLVKHACGNDCGHAVFELVCGHLAVQRFSYKETTTSSFHTDELVVIVMDFKGDELVRLKRHGHQLKLLGCVEDLSVVAVGFCDVLEVVVKDHPLFMLIKFGIGVFTVLPILYEWP
jgi:hypothetical protein